MTTITDKIVRVAEEAGRPIKGAEIAAAMGTHSQAISVNLTAATRDGRLRRIGRGLYEATGKPKDKAQVLGTMDEARAAQEQDIDTTVGNTLITKGDLFEFIATAPSGRLVLRQLDSQTLFVAEALDI